MTDGKQFTGKPNAFENASSYPPVPKGLEPKKPEWLGERTHRGHFDSTFIADPRTLLTDWEYIELGLDFSRKANEMMEDLKDQAEAYLRAFLERTHLTPEEFAERFKVTHWMPSEILNIEDINSNTIRATLSVMIEPRKEYWDGLD